jgi:sugar/nucleoside kinase (ribokinase family)
MPETGLDVVAIGNAIVDVIAHADEAFLAQHDMVKGSMQLIEADAAHALYAAMGPGIEMSGGSAANTTAGVASLGGSPGFIGRVADDVLGEVFTHDLRATGVRYEPLDVVPDERGTARCLILVTPDAQRTLNTYLGVSSLISPGDIDADMIGSAQVLFCEGYLWDLPDAKEALRTAMRLARAEGAEVSFTLSDSFCVDRHRDDFLELAEHEVDILFANEAELLSLYQVDTWEEAATQVAGHCKLACLTRSEKGSVIITEGGDRIEVPAHLVGPVVDTTGAGDLYAAGFLYGYTHGHDLPTSGALASLAGSWRAPSSRSDSEPERRSGLPQPAEHLAPRQRASRSPRLGHGPLVDQ